LLKRTVDHVKAVDGIDFTLRQGETLGIVGESGSGKTTLGRAVLRLVQSQGLIQYQGPGVDLLTNRSSASLALHALNHRQMRPLRRFLQIIFQDPFGSLSPRMSVAQIIAEGLRVHESLSPQAIDDRVIAALADVHLDAETRHRYPHEFSGGQRQRICIARALMLRPEFVICDESVSALDVSIQAQVLNLLLDLQEEFKLTYIFISHDLSVVNFISDEVGVMNKGELVELDRADTIYKQPKEEYTRTLLGAIPKGLPKNLEAFINT
jgi:ABC-type microcin C transport system duplicated ATPase subunit YejF